MELFKADKDIRETMNGLISKHHPHLAIIDKKIAIVFREKASKKGGVPVLSKVSKIQQLVNVLIDDEDTEYVFCIELAHDEWNDLNGDQRTALLDHCLCSMIVDEDDEGELKFGILPPDFVGYREEFQRHGVWRDGGHNVPSAVEELFVNK